MDVSQSLKKGRKKEKKRNSDPNCGPYTRHAEKGALYSLIILSNFYYVPVTCLAQSYIMVTKANMVQLQASGSLESNGRFDQYRGTYQGFRV